MKCFNYSRALMLGFACVTWFICPPLCDKVIVKCVHVVCYNTCICTASLPQIWHTSPVMSETGSRAWVGSLSAPLTSKQPSGWERGQNTAATHTSPLCTRLCVRPRSAHCSDLSRWQCVRAPGPSVTRAVVCLSRLVIERTSLYTERHEHCPDTNTYTQPQPTPRA